MSLLLLGTIMMVILHCVRMQAAPSLSVFSGPDFQLKEQI